MANPVPAGSDVLIGLADMAMYAGKAARRTAASPR